MTEQFLRSLIEPAKKQLKKHINNLRHNPTFLEPIIDRIIKIGIEQTELVIEKTPILRTLPDLCINQIVIFAIQHFEIFITQDDKIQEIRHLIRIDGSFFIVGAGISYGSDMPLTQHLKPILDFIGVSDYESLIKNGQTKLFKIKFKELSDKKEFNESHLLISQNFSKHIEQIICLNWDDLLERAAESKGKHIATINVNEVPNSKNSFLWKFHGDVRKIDEHNIKGKGGWVFPEEGGYVFDAFNNFINKYYENDLYVVVIVGFSENDKAISEVIQKLENDLGNRPLYRIGFDFQKNADHKYLIGPADYILKKIL